MGLHERAIHVQTRSTSNLIHAEVAMKVGKYEALHICVGAKKQNVFRYRIEYKVTKEVLDWLRENFKSYGYDYYYSHGVVWLKNSNQELLFILRWL
jgi:hypothetical protein